MTEYVNRTEKIVFKVYGATMILAGLIMLGLSGWLAWLACVQVTKWPQTTALLLKKDLFKTGGGRLVFRYVVYGQTLTGVAFHWGPEGAVRTALARYTPGTIYGIAYDPDDPRQININLRYNWEMFDGVLFLAMFAALAFALGVSFYRSASG